MNNLLSTTTLTGLVAVTALAALTSVASAAECPERAPSAAKERRALAKEWFNRAEAAENGGDLVAAAKAYQCSLQMVPHAFTAFNLARVAEKTGDLELAVETYGTYLQLSPEAADKAEIEAKISALTARISALRQEGKPTATPEPTPSPDPSQPQRTLSSEPMVHSTGTIPSPSSDGPRVSPLVWVVGGVGVAAVVGGIVLNLGARSKMSDCRKLTGQQMFDAARSACDAAKPRAYASYGLFGLAAAAAVADAVLLMTAKSDETQVSLAPLPDGAALIGRFRF